MSCSPTQGSKAGYLRHWRAGEPSCETCLIQARIYRKRHPWTAGLSPRRVEGHNPGGAPLLILDVVEANQPVTAQELAAFVDKTPSTIRRAMYRLIDTSELVKTGASLTLPEQGDPT